MAKDQKPYLLRMSPSQYDEIKEQSDALGMSMRDFMLQRLAPKNTPGSLARVDLAQAPERLDRLEASLQAFFDGAGTAKSDAALRRAVKEAKTALATV